jgi:hypothetical protein
VPWQIRRGKQALRTYEKLSLPLLMFRILANHTHNTLATDDFAVVTDFFY